MEAKRLTTEDDYVSLKDVEVVILKRISKLEKAKEKNPKKKKRCNDIIINLLAVKSQVNALAMKEQIAHVGYNDMQMGREK